MPTGEKTKELWEDKKYREYMSKVRKGQIPWNKNIHLTKRHKENLSKSHKGQIPWNKGGHQTEEAKEKNRQAHIGNIPWMKNRHHTEEAKLKMREVASSRSAEVIRKLLTRRIPSSLEEKFQTIVAKYNLPYKYVGDGSFILGHYNPDFINTNNEKIAIEVYARYYKKRNKLSIGEWKKERSKVFGEYGWELIFFDETAVNEEHVLNTLHTVGAD